MDLNAPSNLATWKTRILRTAVGTMRGEHKMRRSLLLCVLWVTVVVASSSGQSVIWRRYSAPSGTINPSGPIYLGPLESKEFTTNPFEDIDCWIDQLLQMSGTEADVIPDSKITWVATLGTVTPSVGPSTIYTAGPNPGTGGIALYLDDQSIHTPGGNDPQIRADIETIYVVHPNQESLSWSQHWTTNPHLIGDVFSPHTVKHVIGGVAKSVDFSKISITEAGGWQYVSCTVSGLTQTMIESRFSAWSGSWGIDTGNTRDDSDVHGFNRPALGGAWLNPGVVVINQRMKVTSPSSGSWFTTHGLSFSFKNENGGQDKNCYAKKESDNLNGTKSWVTCPNY